MERCVSWLKEYRPITTRFEHLPLDFLGMLKLGMNEHYVRYIVCFLRQRLAPPPPAPPSERKRQELTSRVVSHTGHDGPDMRTSGTSTINKNECYLPSQWSSQEPSHTIASAPNHPIASLQRCVQGRRARLPTAEIVGHPAKAPQRPKRCAQPVGSPAGIRRPHPGMDPSWVVKRHPTR